MPGFTGIAISVFPAGDTEPRGGRGITTPGPFVSVWVEEIQPFTLVPDEYKDRDGIVAVRYVAFR